MTDPARQLGSLRDRIDEADISEPDREALKEFDDRLTLLNSTYSDYRHVKLLRHLTIMAEKVGGIADALTERETAEDIVRWINRNYDNEETNQDYRVALKVFGRRTTDDGVGGDPDEPPQSLNWIPSTTSKNYDPAPDPGKMLSWHDDVVPMIEETEQERDAAAIALAFDAGLRGFEFRDLTLGDVTDHRYGLQVTANGKQGQRTVTLIPSVPYVTEWLDVHPGDGDPDAPLWSKLSNPSEISYRMMTKIFKQAAERAGVTKPVTLTNFRKSSASYLASQGMNQAHIEDHHGWTRGSSAAARYIAVFGKEADNELARVHGLDVAEDETEDIGPIECPRCQEPNRREANFCSRCSQALQHGAIEAQDEVQQEIGAERALAELEESGKLTPEQIDEIAGDDELMAQLIQARTSTE